MKVSAKEPKPVKSAQRPVVPLTKQQPIELPDGMWERIAEKAYELWEARGRREGYELGDWLDAEDIVMEEIHEARE